jgi:two-component system cell cycle response regulator
MMPGVQNNLKLLVIEDDADQRDLIRETLQAALGERLAVSIAASKREALAQDLALFHLILCDYNLPDATGLELLDEIRARCNTPVIMVTGENVAHIAAEAIRKGATDYVVKTGDYLFTIPLIVQKNLIVANIKRENEKLRQELEAALLEVRHKNVQLEQSLKKVEELAATDPLTGLYNRRHFGRVLEQLFAEAQRYGKDMACVMIDLDHYKQLNDTYGHQVGDELLILAGKVISANMRRMDIAARYGGDEFVLLLPHASAGDATLAASRIQEEFKHASAVLLKKTAGLSMSIGVGSIGTSRPNTVDQLISSADSALYYSKEMGRDRLSLATGTRAEIILRG